VLQAEAGCGVGIHGRVPEGAVELLVAHPARSAATRMYATCTFFRWPFSVNVIWTARWAGLGGRRMADAYRAPPAVARGDAPAKSILECTFG